MGQTGNVSNSTRWLVYAVIVLGGAIVFSSVNAIVTRERTERAARTCAANMFHLDRAMQMYLADYDDAFPLASSWCDAIVPYTEAKPPFNCPAARNQRFSFAYNAAVAGRRRAEIQNLQEVVLLFESDAGWNAAGGPELLPEEPRHFGGDRVTRANFSSSWMSRASRERDRRKEWLREYRGLIWTPILQGGDGGR